MDRRMTLLKKAATEFIEGRSPFVDSWLIDNDVTFDECMQLSVDIGDCIEVFFLGRRD